MFPIISNSIAYDAMVLTLSIIYHNLYLLIMETFLTVEQVASKLQIHWQTVLRYIKTGKLRAAKLGRGYRVDPIDLETFVEKLKTNRI